MKEILFIPSILIIGDSINKEIFKDVCGYSLDKDQIKVCLSKKDAILVVAGAGSGKSLTIIGKIKYLIEVEKVIPSEILCITFTNEAAKSLECKINNYYNYDMKVYTFHKLALEIIKKKVNIANNVLGIYSCFEDCDFESVLDMAFINATYSIYIGNIITVSQIT